MGVWAHIPKRDMGRFGVMGVLKNPDTPMGGSVQRTHSSSGGSVQRTHSSSGAIPGYVKLNPAIRGRGQGQDRKK